MPSYQPLFKSSLLFTLQRWSHFFLKLNYVPLILHQSSPDSQTWAQARRHTHCFLPTYGGYCSLAGKDLKAHHLRTSSGFDGLQNLTTITHLELMSPETPLEPSATFLLCFVTPSLRALLAGILERKKQSHYNLRNSWFQILLVQNCTLNLMEHTRKKTKQNPQKGQFIFLRSSYRRCKRMRNSHANTEGNTWILAWDFQWGFTSKALT